jgi:hypothetical protein
MKILDLLDVSVIVCNPMLRAQWESGHAMRQASQWGSNSLANSTPRRDILASTGIFVCLSDVRIALAFLCFGHLVVDLS